VPRDGGVVRLHVKEGYFFTPPKRVTSPTLGPPPSCKQALHKEIKDYSHVDFIGTLENVNRSKGRYQIFTVIWVKDSLEFAMSHSD